MSFHRRLSLHLQKTDHIKPLDSASGWDKALVRHLYDVHQIIQSDPDAISDPENLARIVSSVIVHDAIEFENQHPQFYLTPLVQLNDALIWAGESESLKNQYQSFVADMVYASPTETPSFEEALHIFSLTLQTSLALINAEDIAKSLVTANKIN